MSSDWEKALKQADELATDDHIHEAAELIVNNYCIEFIDKYKKEMFEDDEDDVIWSMMCGIIIHRIITTKMRNKMLSCLICGGNIVETRRKKKIKPFMNILLEELS